MIREGGSVVREGLRPSLSSLPSPSKERDKEGEVDK